jgi:superfamily II DNA/RNA helicase
LFTDCVHYSEESTYEDKLYKNSGLSWFEFLKEHKKISVGEVNTIATKVVQEVIVCKDKYSELKNYLTSNTGTSIIFVKTQRMTEILDDKLREDVLHNH